MAGSADVSETREALERSRRVYEALREELTGLYERICSEIPHKRDDITTLMNKAVLLGTLANFIRYLSMYLRLREEVERRGLMVA